MAVNGNKKIRTIRKQQENATGAVKVHESVIASIVRKATMDIAGVMRLAGNSIVDNIAEIVGSKRIQDRAINVEMGDSSVAVEVKIILEYGVHVPTVALDVQRAIAAEIQALTGMTATKVNVMVYDLEDVQMDGIE